MSDGLKRYTMRELDQEIEVLALDIIGAINTLLTEFSKRTAVIVDVNASINGQHPNYGYNGDVVAPMQLHSWYFCDVDIKPVMPSNSRDNDEEFQEGLRLGFLAERDGKVYDSYHGKWVDPKP